jgi:leader peptidase (prepilin peptidase)/N-methyltransferase
MVIAVLLVVGLCLGSFVNALVWRVHEQAKPKDKEKTDKKYLKQLSITKGRSMCPHCQHELATKDLIPVLSWLSLKGKCRYCSRPISTQYPLVELATAGLFVASYIWWPVDFSTAQTIIFVLWLALLAGFMALIVYDLRWSLLPNRILYPLGLIAGLMAVVAAVTADRPLIAVINTLLAIAVGGGIFYIIFQISAGKWIGGGDVRLGWLLGLVMATPARSVLLIFVASLLGSLISLALLAAKRVQRHSVIPFGPYLIIAAIVVQLFGHTILFWYQKTFLPFTV